MLKTEKKLGPDPAYSLLFQAFYYITILRATTETKLASARR